jgi:hypothetical protein
MEPNKLENQIREKLNSREIQPSPQSWDRLEAKLSILEDKKPEKRFRWIYLAASIIGFVFVGLLFYNQESSNQEIKKNNNQTLVEANSSKEEILPEEIKEVPSTNKEEILVIAEPKKALVKATSTDKNIQEFLKVQPENKEIIAAVIPQKVEVKPKNEGDSEILLASVETKNELKTINKPKLKIDPSALLSQVDGEMTLTFRQKVLKSINKNYDSAKEVLASRNQE